jgi:hypothetical protein
MHQKNINNFFFQTAFQSLLLIFTLSPWRGKALALPILSNFDLFCSLAEKYFCVELKFIAIFFFYILFGRFLSAGAKNKKIK